MGLLNHYSDDVFEFDPNTGDMILNLGSNHNRFDSFRNAMENNDIGVDHIEWHEPQHSKDLLSEDPEIDWKGYRGHYGGGKYNYSTGRYETSDDSEKNIEWNFSITLRSNAKQKFKFFENWYAKMARVWVADDPAKPRDGHWVPKEDEIEIRKSTEVDSKWKNRILRQAKVFF